MPITIVTCGIAKMFVGELVETGKDWCKVSNLNIEYMQESSVF